MEGRTGRMGDRGEPRTGAVPARGRDWQASEKYTDEILTAGYSGTAYLHPANGTVLLSAVSG